MSAPTHEARRGLAAIAIALLSALCFTQTCVLNRAIATATRVLRTDRGA